MSIADQTRWFFRGLRRFPSNLDVQNIKRAEERLIEKRLARPAW